MYKLLVTCKFGSLLAFSLFLSGCDSGKNKTEMASASIENKEYKVELERKDEEKRIDVTINGQHFTSYIYPESVEKPVLYPIITSGGNHITRGYPLDARPGERVDHPHHVGLWFNYGDVNGLDFWNNSNAIPEKEKNKYGSIIHKEINNISNDNDQGSLEVTSHWVDQQGNVLLEENTVYNFKGAEGKRIIDRITTLRAIDKDVSMKDNKEGVLGIRLARELEHPAEKPEIFTDAGGKATDVPVLNNEGVTGKYRSSEGIEGHDVWGTRGKWMNLSGNINGENVSVAMFDHPENVGYPTYWHARGYGLYAANPLGQKALSDGKEELDFKLSSGEAVTFKHRIIVYSGQEVTDENVNNDYEDFIK